jgi:hypothetical protein
MLFRRRGTGRIRRPTATPPIFRRRKKRVAVLNSGTGRRAAGAAHAAVLGGVSGTWLNSGRRIVDSGVAAAASVCLTSSRPVGLVRIGNVIGLLDELLAAGGIAGEGDDGVEHGLGEVDGGDADAARCAVISTCPATGFPTGSAWQAVR